ncbi:hypothetical protein PV327_006233 [Microctonus hyperodae]|uniref:Uncharacterized protein n=1 Tax=Microctonus hyperodae TaxID=165561 RepID=A0AA39KHX5_MICHY|nr:hypothetical protein PV327_006233 [Microctonus hyperodae]
MQSLSIVSSDPRNVVDELPSGSGLSVSQLITSSRLTSSSCKIMDGYPVLQIVRCRLGPDAPATEGPMGYPFAMAAHSHSHLAHNGNYNHFTRNNYRHPCGTFHLH